MTIICWDGEILAADSLYAYIHNCTVAAYLSKIKIVNQKAVAACGAEPDVLAFYDWVENGMEPEEFPSVAKDEFQGIVVDHKGLACLYAGDGTGKPDLALGRISLGDDAASHYCNALMDTGMRAPEAVTKVKKYSLMVGGPVNSVSYKTLATIHPDQNFMWKGKVPKNFLKAR